MTRNDSCYLVQKTYTKDATTGEYIEVETKIETPCRVDSISSSEWSNGGLAGLKPEYRIVVFYANYSDEEVLIYKDVRYAIYRIYRNGNDMELYVEKQGGVTHGQ